MIEGIIAWILLIVGSLFDKPFLVLASGLYAIAVNIGNIARAYKKEGAE